MPDSISPPAPNRLGFHYFPDTLHYRQQDLLAWLPELRSLGAAWLVLLAPSERAIPEPFLRGLIEAGIQPILHFQFAPEAAVERQALQTLFSSYARWGVRYAILYDRPNCRSRWSPAAWMQNNLVERFLDAFLPLSEIVVQSGLLPVFPPLEPGGDYWDLAFLRTALGSMQRRGCQRLLPRLTLGAYAALGDHGLDWGAGGPARWPAARPYNLEPGIQDQRGFRIFEWYQAVSQDEIGRELPVILLSAASDAPVPVAMAAAEAAAQADYSLALARLMAGGEPDQEVLPSSLLACNLWSLCGADGARLPAVDALRRWFSSRQPGPAAAESFDVAGFQASTDGLARPISHYVLLPLYAWGAADWGLDLIAPLLQQAHPTVGFSLEEACLAGRVTAVGGPGAFSDEALQTLRQAGCIVERLLEDGTLLAT
ncbi:MAG: hypothetical protein AB1894_12455 [Chloroflexota bacterium]